MGTFIKNLETGKIELHFDKSEYLALSEDQKREIKSAFLFSRHAGAWVSRAKDPNLWRAIEVAKGLGLTFDGETGERLAFSEQVERQQDKASARAARMQARADKADQASTAQYTKAKEISRHIPFGQPILVGHHSEGRHRRDLAKIDNAMRKSVELADKAKYYRNRADAAAFNASDEKYQNVTYLLNRIAECRKHLRAIDRSLQGKDMINKQTGQRMVNGCEIPERRRIMLEQRKAEWTDKLDFFTEKLQEAGGGQLTAERLKEAKPKYVKVRGKWWPLKSINRDTVTVLNWLGIAGWTWKFKFDQIQSMEAGHVTVVYDRDGNQVTPTIKYAN